MESCFDLTISISYVSNDLKNEDDLRTEANLRLKMTRKMKKPKTLRPAHNLKKTHLKLEKLPGVKTYLDLNMIKKLRKINHTYAYLCIKDYISKQR